MKKTLLVTLITLLLIISCTGCGVSQEKQEELVSILFERSETNNSYHDDMLAGSGDFGKLYMQVKDTESFRQIVYDKYNALLSEQSGTQYNEYMDKEYIDQKTNILKDEGLFTSEMETLYAEYTDNIAKYYSERIDQALADKRYEDVAKDLAWLIKQNLFEQSGCDINVVVEKLMEGCSIYSVQTGKGAYYDFAELRDSSSSVGLGVDWMPPIGYRSSSYKELAYGDFCIGKSSSKTYYEGLADTYLASKYNTSTSSLSVYLRGKEISGYGWADTLAWTADHGAEFVFCHETINENNRLEVDHILMIGKDALYPMTYYGEHGYNEKSSGVSIEGDFSKSLEQIKQLYNEKYSSEVEMNYAIDHMNKQEYKEALDILKYYTHLEDCANLVYNIILECIRNNQEELGFEALRYLEGFSAIRGASIEDILSSLERKFDADVKYRDDTYQVFLRLMMDVWGTMNNDQITEALSGQAFKDIPDYRMKFETDGTGYSMKPFSHTSYFKWYVKDNQLYIHYDGKSEPKSYNVYNIYDQFYLLTYTTSYSSNVFMTLLK